MQKKILGFSLVMAVALAVVCVLQWQRLQVVQQHLTMERRAREAELQTRAAQDQRLQSLERQRNQLDRDVQGLAALVTMLRGAESQSSSNLARWKEQMATARSGDAANSASGEKAGVLGGKGMSDMLRKMMKDPAMKEMMRSQQKSMMNMMYGGLFQELNLSPEQKEKFTELLLDGQMGNIEQASSIFDADATTRTEVTQAIGEAKKQQDDKIKALLGEEKFAQYEEYQKDIGDRMQLDQFKGRLQDGPTALQDEQVKQLLALMKDEKTKVPPVVPDKLEQLKQPFVALLKDETMEKQFQWQADLNRRVLERAGEVLTPEQLKHFSEFQTDQLNLQKFSMKMAREMFGGAGQTDKTTPAPETPK
jgi:hypothetical protein